MPAIRSTDVATATLFALSGDFPHPTEEVKGMRAPGSSNMDHPFTILKVCVLDAAPTVKFLKKCFILRW